ncbi:hypothetical protein B0H10DRAFT_2209794 [Mycena sp. CBHHK59/15]|nr:hypothetical protein B0H10DRAFT_2209794 [Mycena sp. CBHHK59/15]
MPPRKKNRAASEILTNDEMEGFIEDDAIASEVDEDFVNEDSDAMSVVTDTFDLGAADSPQANRRRDEAEDQDQDQDEDDEPAPSPVKKFKLPIAIKAKGAPESSGQGASKARKSVPMADVLEISDSDDEFPDGISLPPAKATKSTPRKKVVEFTPPLATRSASKKLLFTPTTPDSRVKRGKVSKTQLEEANRSGTPSGNGTLSENERAESPPWSSSKRLTAERAPAMNTSDNIDNRDSLKLTTLKRSPVKKAKPIPDDGSDDADNVIISTPVAKSKMKATTPNTKKIGMAKTKASDGIEEPTLSSSANGKGKESSLSSRKAKTKMDVDGEDHAGDVGGKLEAAAQINSRKPKAKPSGGLQYLDAHPYQHAGWI